ncbi:MAG: TolC family protein [Burkholderiales bacterium]|nr:TolC family protein [Burkholderiales bacterium]
MTRTTWKRITITWLAQVLLLASAPVLAGDEDAALPPEANVVDVLVQSPAYQASLRSIDAEQSVHRQLQVGPQEWRSTLSAARRTQNGAIADRTNEWEFGLERTLRLPGKAAAYDRAGQAKVDQAEAIRQKIWRDQGRLLLDRFGAWLREREAARVWLIQAELLRQQVETVAMRQRIGDAARIEQQQAEAAFAQARAQAQAASGRTLAARDAVDRQFPGLDLAQDLALPTPKTLPTGDAGFIDAQVARSPELELARREADAAVAQMRLDAAEIRPDPTLGLRLGRARNGSEQYAGVVLSVPFGGEYRAAGAAAAASRAAAAAQQQLDAQRRIEAEAVLHLRQAQTAYYSWLGNADAARRLSEAADSVAKGYRLGEGSLGDVLTARRLANEQQLAASVGAVDAWMTRYRLELETGRLWTPPGSVP